MIKNDALAEKEKNRSDSMAISAFCPRLASVSAVRNVICSERQGNRESVETERYDEIELLQTK